MINLDPIANVRQKLEEAFTDDFLETLLTGMNWAFEAHRFGLLEDFHKNIVGFKGTYVFQTSKGGVDATAVFENDDMRNYPYAFDEWDVKVVFKNDDVLRAFLLKGVHGDALTAVLDNDVQVYGNANYLFKFGYMARDLFYRFGLL